jgi:hypothetical protein
MGTAAAAAAKAATGARQHDVRRRVTTDGKAAAPGEWLEFLALIQGWQSEARRERREQLL